MNHDARKGSRIRLQLGAVLVALGVAHACAPKAAHRQTDIMEKVGRVTVSAAQLRASVNDLADRLAGRLEATADEIGAETRDRAVRRRALVYKIEAIPALYSAAYRADPLAAALDVWGFSFQLGAYLENGAGRELFGSQQALARKGASDMLAEADAALRIVTQPEGFDRGRARVEDWATRHPIEHSLASRASIAVSMSELRAEEKDAFVAVGEVSDTLENISERLNTYAAQMPRQARWSAELLALDLAEDRDVHGLLGDVHELGTAAHSANALMGDLPGQVSAEGSPVREAVAAERRAVLAGLNGQRLETLAYMTGERLAVVAALKEERIATLAALREERIETLKELDAIKSRAVDSAVNGLQGIVEYALFRLALFGAFMMLLAATLTVVAYWLTIGRRARRAE